MFRGRLRPHAPGPWPSLSARRLRLGAFVAGAVALVAIAAMPSAGDSTESTVAHTVTRAPVGRSIRLGSGVGSSGLAPYTHTVVKRVTSAGPIRQRRAFHWLGILAFALAIVLAAWVPDHRWSLPWDQPDPRFLHLFPPLPARGPPAL